MISKSQKLFVSIAWFSKLANKTAINVQTDVMQALKNGVMYSTLNFIQIIGCFGI